MSNKYDKDEKKAYKALGLPEGASDVEIKKHYYELAKKVNPDNGLKPDEAQFKEINWAHETLTNPAEIKAREQAKRRAAAERTKAEAKAKAAREQRKRGTKESERFGERLRGQSDGAKDGAPKAPPQTPSPSSSPSTPPPSSSPGQHQTPTSAPSLWRVVFLVVPIGIMALVIPAKNAHPSAFLDVVSVLCFFGLIAGVAAIFIEW